MPHSLHQSVNFFFRRQITNKLKLCKQVTLLLTFQQLTILSYIILEYCQRTCQRKRSSLEALFQLLLTRNLIEVTFTSFYTFHFILTCDIVIKLFFFSSYTDNHSNKTTLFDDENDDDNIYDAII